MKISFNTSKLCETSWSQSHWVRKNVTICKIWLLKPQFDKFFSQPKVEMIGNLHSSLKIHMHPLRSNNFQVTF